MSWFQDAFLWPQLLTSGKGRDQLKDDIKYGKGTAAVGNPLHGLTAGFKVHELMSPTVHINDRIQDIKKNGFDSDHLKWAIKDQNHNLQDAFKENIPALGMFLGGGAGGAFGGGGSGAGAGLGGASGGSSAGAGTGLGSASGLEGVTVVGSGGVSAADVAAASMAAGAGAGAVQNPNMGMESPKGGGFNWQELMQQGMGGGQRQQPTPPEQQPSPQRAGLGRQQSFMDKLTAGLFPVDSRAADAIGPEAVQQQRNSALIRMGLGMMAASNQGAGLGEALFTGLGTAQNSLDGALQRGYENAREARMEQRQAERDQIADHRYEREFQFETQRADRADERDQRNFDRQLALDERALQWRGQDIERENEQFDRRMRVAEDRANSGIIQPPSGYRWNAQGDLEPIPGGPADPSNKTGNYQEAERTAAFLGTRLADSLRTLKTIPVEDQEPGYLEKGLQALGADTAANIARSENRQKASAAQRDALDAALTLATGAAYTKEQIEAMRESYFPQIGDTEAVKADKAKRLEMLIEAARVKAGRAADQIDTVLGRTGGATGTWSIRLKQ